MLYVLIGFLLLVILVLLVFRSPRIGVNPIENWQQLHKMLSVQLSALAGLMVSAIPALEALHEQLPQIESIRSIHGLTSSPGYQLSAGLLSFVVIVARAWKQGSLQKPP